jgi:MFS superfamily sulfate permease-like transporter
MMGETKPIIWFTDDKKPNRFFFQSPFRSWKFLINTALLVLLCLAYLLMAWKYWNQVNSFHFWELQLTWLLLMVVQPFVWALKRHGKINRLFREGKIAAQPAESPLDDLLEVADNAINDGLRNTSLLLGVFLLVNLWWQLERFR